MSVNIKYRNQSQNKLIIIETVVMYKYKLLAL